MQRYSDFISQHLNDDPRDLALRQSRYPDIDIPYVVQQISAWQTAKKKLPLWAETTGIEYPVHLSMEQCSSQLTAEYKAQILSAISKLPILREESESSRGGKSFTDLTAGFGVDATILSRCFEHLNYVERNEELCRIAANNLPLLDITSFDVYNVDASEVLPNLPHQSLIFLDPARRDQNGGKTVQISDCTPDVSLLQDRLLDKADLVMVKLSPMLDIANILRDLKGVKEIHVVSVDNECKELLVLMSALNMNQSIRIVCANLKTKGTNEIYSYNLDQERTSECHYAQPSALEPHNASDLFLYEPNVSIMKAGCFRSVAQSFNVEKLHPSSHLYVSNQLITDFPGRKFKIQNVYTLKDKALKQIKKANLTVRNFPSTVAELRKRLKLSEGGTQYLFATTLADESKVIIEGVKEASF